MPNFKQVLTYLRPERNRAQQEVQGLDQAIRAIR